MYKLNQIPYKKKKNHFIMGHWREEGWDVELTVMDEAANETKHLFLWGEGTVGKVFQAW